MHSSTTLPRMEIEPVGSMPERVEKFYIIISMMARLNKGSFSAIAKKIQNIFARYINNKFVLDNSHLISKDKLLLDNYLNHLIIQAKSIYRTDAVLFVAIREDILNDSKLLVNSFNDEFSPITLLQRFDDIRNKQLQSAAITAAVHFQQPVNQTNYIFIHQALASTMEKILADGDYYFKLGLWEEALSTYKIGHRILNLKNSPANEQIVKHSNKIQQRLGKTSVAYGKSCVAEDPGKAAELFNSAWDFTENINQDDENIGLNALIELARMTFQKFVAFENSHVNRAKTFLKFTIISLQNLTNKYPQLFESTLLILDNLYGRMGNMLMRQLYDSDPLPPLEKTRLAEEAVTAFESISIGNSNYLDHTHISIARRYLAIWSLNNVSLNITKKQKIYFLNKAIFQNNLLIPIQGFPNLDAAFQKMFLLTLMGTLIQLTPVLNWQQKLHCTKIVDNEMNKIPLNLLDEESKYLYDQNKKHFIFSLHPQHLFINKKSGLINQSTTKRRLKTIFNLLSLVNNNFISTEEKTYISRWHQLYAYYSIEQISIISAYNSAKNIQQVYAISRGYMTIAALMVRKDDASRNLLKNFSYSLHLYAKKLSQNTSDLGDAIKTQEFAVDIMKLIPSKERKLEEKVILAYHRKTLQHLNADFFYHMDLEECSTKTNINQLLWLTSSIRGYEVKGFENEDLWHINKLDVKYEFILDYCEKQLEEKINALAKVFLAKPYFFSPSIQKNNVARELQKLYQHLLKPLQKLKNEDLFEEALEGIDAYLTNQHPMYLEEVYNIRRVIRKLLHLQVSNECKLPKLTRSASSGALHKKSGVTASDTLLLHNFSQRF